MKVVACLLAFALACAVAMPSRAEADGSTDAALALGSFAVLNQLLRGETILHDIFGRHQHYAGPPRQTIFVQPPPHVIYYAPPPPTVIYTPDRHHHHFRGHGHHRHGHHFVPPGHYKKQYGRYGKYDRHN